MRRNDYSRVRALLRSRPAAPPLSFEERQIVRRFDEAPDPWCRLCDGVGEVQARLPHVQTWDRIPCPECMPTVAR